LGINNKRVSGARVDDCSIFKRDSISRESFGFPSGLHGKVGKNEERVDSFS
jgi:hypothetical protein